jgi:nucleolar GTP-binding protein
MDLSEMCGFSIQDQISLFENISPLFRLKQLIAIINKIDLIGLDDLNPKTP